MAANTNTLVTAHGSVVEKPTFFSASGSLVSVIKRAIGNKQDIAIDAGALGSITLLTKRGEYFGEPGSVEAICKNDAGHYKVVVIKDSGEAHPKEKGKNIDELMWCAGYYASDGRLMEGLLREDVVELMYWPNFTRLPHKPSFMRLAALLTKHPTSIAMAQHYLKIAPDEVYQFYTAASCAGLARPVNRAATEPKLKPHRNQALLAKLLNKIAGM